MCLKLLLLLGSPLAHLRLLCGGIRRVGVVAVGSGPHVGAVDDVVVVGEGRRAGAGAVAAAAAAVVVVLQQGAGVTLTPESHNCTP